MNRAIFTFMESASPYLVVWSAAFTLLTLVRLGARLRRDIPRVPDSAAITELAGLPLTLMQPVCFVWALASRDWLSALLFLWWGPGFVAAAVAVIVSKRTGIVIDWHPLRYVISYLCKGYYLAFVAVFFALGMPGMMFAFSVWIINDQFEKACMSLDADRLRRTLDDHWLFRILYPAGLLVPWFAPAIVHRSFAVVYGTGLFLLWLGGLFYVSRKGGLRQRPADPSLLRNMVYFPRLPR
jgi:hypothetical protein